MATVLVYLYTKRGNVVGAQLLCLTLKVCVLVLDEKLREQEGPMYYGLSDRKANKERNMYGNWSNPILGITSKTPKNVN